jgi:hypothetical protein
MSAERDLAAIVGLALLMVPVSVIAALILQASRARKIARIKRRLHEATEELCIAGWQAEEATARAVRVGAAPTLPTPPAWLPTADWRDAGPVTWQAAIAHTLRRWAAAIRGWTGSDRGRSK